MLWFEILNSLFFPVYKLSQEYGQQEIMFDIILKRQKVVVG